MSSIIIRNYTAHKITYKSATAESGYFSSPPSTLIPSSGLKDEVKIKITWSSGKAFLVGFGLVIPALVGVEKAAGGISLSVQAKSHSYTVCLGCTEQINPHTNKAGIEIRGGEYKLGMDKDTLHGVDVTGAITSVADLCREKHCGPSDQWHSFYEDAKSSDTSEGFTIRGKFVDLAGANFYFEFHPLNTDGSGYRS